MRTSPIGPWDSTVATRPVPAFGRQRGDERPAYERRTCPGTKRRVYLDDSVYNLPYLECLVMRYGGIPSSSVRKQVFRRSQSHAASERAPHLRGVLRHRIHGDSTGKLE